MSDRVHLVGPGRQDAFTAYWLGQAMLRMRRELCWLWRNHRSVDWLAESLERNNTAVQRERFFQSDETARYLHEQIAAAGPPPAPARRRRGSFAWLVRTLRLSPAEIFVVALALLGAQDAQAGNLFAALHGDDRKTLPSLGLAQWMGDDPQALAPLTARTHALYMLGILRRIEGGDGWSAALSMPPLAAQSLMGRQPAQPPEVQRIADGREAVGSTANAIEVELLSRRMRAAPDSLRVVPIAMPFSSEHLDVASAAPLLKRIAARTGRPIFAPRPGLVLTHEALEMLGTSCWLAGGDLLLPSRGLPAAEFWQTALAPFPLYAFVAARDEDRGASVERLPVLRIPALTLQERLEHWNAELSRLGIECAPGTVELCAHRFRLGAEGISRVAGSLHGGAGAKPLHEMVAACELEVGLQIGSNAKLIAPRFRREELVLDAERTGQFEELLQAMEAIAEVHAHWGTGRVWGNAGISALFAGAPGTGKTMAAEVLASRLRLPMYRVDLSQVVNKYIGETEKNLRVLFDAAEQADLLLFFDEADALFGQRTSVKSSNDRFANIEVSYLLERMENFRGLAILATNRKKDLDEAFLRRLRYVIEFPLPGESERRAIWQKAIPPEVDAADVDLDFLAAEFPLAGGNIRSIVLNACLQSAAHAVRPSLRMNAVMHAVMREYEKLGRPLTQQQMRQWTAPEAEEFAAARNGQAMR